MTATDFLDDLDFTLQERWDFVSGAMGAFLTTLFIKEARVSILVRVPGAGVGDEFLTVSTSDDLFALGTALIKRHYAVGAFGPTPPGGVTP